MEDTTKQVWNPFKKDFWLAPGPSETYSAPVVIDNTVDPGPSAPGPLPGVIPPPRDTVLALTPRTALTISPVYRAVDIIKKSVSQLPLQVQRSGVEIKAPAFVVKPDAFSTQTTFLSVTAGQLATYGNCFWRVHRDQLDGVEDPQGRVQSIEVLNYELVSIEWDKGRKVYRYRNTTFAEWQISHLMIFPQFEDQGSTLLGLGPIQANRRELQAIYELNDKLNDFYRNNAVPQGIVSTDQALGAGEGDRIRADWMHFLNTGQIPVLPKGMNFQQIQADPEKAQWHASWTKAVADVARMFGIPDRYLLAAVDGTSMTYSNMSQVDRQFVVYTLMDYLNAIEDAFSALLPGNQRAKFNVDGFPRGTPKERNEALAMADYMTVNEKRALNDLPAIAEGDALARPAGPATNSNEGVSNDNNE